jgi:predicted DCC family thiol-disulfide oxidoreductase YuxK
MPPRAILPEDLSATGLAGLREPLIVFDGICHLCAGFVQFVIRHDHERLFRFLPAQSPRGTALYARFGLKSADWDSNLLIADGLLYTDLDSFIEVTRRFGGIWRMTIGLYLLPRPLRAWLYNRIARNRYRWFGKRETCYLPRPELAARFLD